MRIKDFIRIRDLSAIGIQSLFKCLKGVGKGTCIFESKFRDNAGLAPSN